MPTDLVKVDSTKVGAEDIVVHQLGIKVVDGQLEGGRSADAFEEEGLLLMMTVLIIWYRIGWCSSWHIVHALVLSTGRGLVSSSLLNFLWVDEGSDWIRFFCSKPLMAQFVALNPNTRQAANSSRLIDEVLEHNSSQLFALYVHSGVIP